MRNDEILAMLSELAQLTVLEDRNPQSFRARAYDNARHAIEGLDLELEELSEKQLKALPGIGKATAAKIRAYFDTGSVPKLELLRERHPPSVVALSRLPGLGPKTLRRLRDELDIQSIDDLRGALERQELRALSGLGARTEENLSRALDRLGLHGGPVRTPIAAAMKIARSLARALTELPQVERVEICGSVRRQRETIGDLDLVAATTDPVPVMAWFAERPVVDEVLVRGETKTSVRTREGLQIDLRCVEPEAFGAAILYFTGSKAHNIKLRARAQRRGWTLNEYALSDAETGRPLASATEEEIYAALELPHIPAPMREDTGEIEAAEAGTLPDPLRASDLLGDLHVHTDLSGDGRSPLEVMVQDAARRGYRYLAITDHGQDLAINGVDRDGLLRQADELAALGERYPDLKLLRGCELNIGPEGGLDYDPEFRAGLDWCVAAVHTHFGLSQAQQTERVIRAIADPCVRVIGHLTGRMIGRRPGIELDTDAVLEALAEHDVALEINSALPRLDAAAPLLRRARTRGVVFIVSTDAHHVRELERVRWGARQAQRGWVARDQVANTWSPERFDAWRTRSS